MSGVEHAELDGSTGLDPARVFAEIDRFAGFRPTSARAVASMADGIFISSLTKKWLDVLQGNVAGGVKSSRDGNRIVVTHSKTELGEDASQRYVDVKLVFDGSEATGLTRVTASEVRFDTVGSLPRMLDTTIVWVSLKNGALEADRVRIPNVF